MVFVKGHKLGKRFKKGRVPWNKGKGYLMPTPWNKGLELGKVKRICQICGKEFKTKKCEVKRGGGKYCSRGCFFKSVTFQVTKNCLQCSKPFRVMRYEFKIGKGKFCSFSCQAKYNMTGRIGDKANNWRGGTTKLVLLIRHCRKYDHWRLSIFIRDNFTCVHCGYNKKKNIQVDHYPLGFAEILHKYNIKTYEKALSLPLLWDINNGRTLCVTCHKKTANYLKATRYRSTI